MSKQILIVDDDREISQAAGMRLRAAGFETIHSHDGEAGIHSAKQCLPSAIVLDIRMPHKNGFEVVAELAEDPTTRHIPIVMLSASIVDQQAALEAGVKFFVNKPYDGKALVSAIEKVTTESSAETENNLPSTV